MSKQAWVTLATNDSYGLGALVLAHSLRRVGSVYPAVVLITPSVTEAMRERLRAVFAEVVVVNVLDSQDATHLALLQRPELGITFTKIHCWNLTQYEKAVFLDADTLVVQNCDELFEREELSAAPDVGWPDCFNSGVFVFKPSAETFSNLITFASERGSFDGGDQGLLNSYFSDWAHGDIKKHLPFLYNVTSAAFYSYLPALKHYGQNLKIIHFIGAVKPWLQQFNWTSRSVEAPEHLRDFLQLWWDLFVAQVHAQLDTNMDNIEDDSPAVHQQEIPEFREPVLHNIYYEPILDPDSEFPWHHPDNQILDSEINVPEFDMNQFHDPWNIYRGNIPPSTEQSNPTEQTIDDYQDMRKYAWDYMPPQQEQRNFDSSYEQKLQDHCQHVHEHNETNIHHSEHEHQSHSFPFHSESHNTQQQLQDTQINTLHNYVEQQQINNHEPHNYHEHHYTYSNRLENNKSDLNVHNDESQNNNHVSNISHNIHDKEGSKQSKKKDWSSRSQYRQQNKTEQVYTVMMDHVRMRCQHSSKTKVNGYDSDSDSDVYEELRPRHPYDGFYLRHRMTIDARGRKVCIHEIPFIPRSPTPESSEEFEDAIETILEDINDNTVNDEEIQTGVAANLARVVPGAPLQQDAVDELARRQGWEAGNIDYMGADSFDNIWAKISQTLNQPASQSEQSSEPQPKAVDETVAAVEAAPEKQTVLPALEKEVKETEVPKSTEPEPANIPVPAAEAKPSGKIEEPIPVPVEMAAEVPEIVDVVAPVEPSSPIVVTEQSEQTSIPVAALEALKIDEPLPEALLPVTVVEQPPVPEPTPEVPSPVSVVEQPPVPEQTPEVPSPVSVVEQPPVPEPTPEVPLPVSVVEQPPVPEPTPEVPLSVPVVEQPPVPEPTPEVPLPVTVVEQPPVPEPTSEAPLPETVVERPPVPEPTPEASLPVTVVEQSPVPEPTPEASLPVTVVEQPPVPEPTSEATLPVTVVEQPPASEPTPETPAPIPETAELKPETPATKAEADSDSPPLANTPSKEEIPEAANAKTTEEAAQETRL
ncbi:probable serine/threonine-protein kinase kinX isoform X2 [Vanessa cardui]|uniref:probable serine/threonine-protein kinase kinX isoform X2 n=1 Tax=Vanessa cardui TaxID=171605 RepID=UPI001F148A2C|nr:probable serine/threonine-protein kinase kinX isoform X2 [Vanessa cardui]XP_046961539.1 probable serine/threonine-protein kinase kinX isoform X2 [Vanessa cardui]